MTSLASVVTKLGAVKAHVKPVAEEIAEHFGPLYFIWGAPGRGTGDHASGQALDFMVYELGGGIKNPGEIRHSLGVDIAQYVLANRVRLNVSYIIWDKRIVSAKSNWKWRPYDGGNPHIDHVHVSFKEKGTYKPPTTKEDDTVADDAKVLAYVKEAYADTTTKLNTFEERAIQRFEALKNAIEALAAEGSLSTQRNVKNAFKDVK